MLSVRDIVELALHPENMGQDTLADLREAVSACPYSHIYRILLLQNMYCVSSPDFDSEMSRSRVFLPCVDEMMGVMLDAMSRRQAGQLENDRTMVLLNALLGQDMQMDQELPEYSAASEDYLASAGLDADASDISAEEMAHSGDRLSLTDSLLDSIFGGHVDDTLSLNVSAPAMDVPVAMASALEPDEEFNAADDDKPVLNEELFTETLAGIYIKQHRYQEAMEIIRSLSLNFPNKSSYFADQIRYLEKIEKINNKKDK